MKNFGLKFLLADGLFLMAIMPEKEAREIIQKYLSREYQLRDVQTIGDPKPAVGDAWVVRLSDVRGIHTVDLEALERQQRAMQQQAMSPQNFTQTRYTSGY